MKKKLLIFYLSEQGRQRIIFSMISLKNSESSAVSKNM